ncbi:MAG: branched-chain amino acid ABC transporter permease [Chloroflexi bacterium]|nr:branched-chain amino acid ABC transporter permease [Chloroflexota bacterium]
MASQAQARPAATFTRFSAVQLGVIAAGAVLFLVAPLFVQTYELHLLIMILFYSYLGACWNILAGYCGQFSFGHALFVGIGAYTSTILFMRIGLSPWIGMLAGGAVAGFAGWLVGYLSFRYGLRGIYFGLVTLAFAEVARLSVLGWDFAGGAVGILIPLRGDDPFAFQFAERQGYYYTILGLMALVLVVTAWIERSRLGYYFQAIRENEEAAEALGIDAFRYKLWAMIISATLTAFAGTFYAQYFFYIDPHLVFGVEVTIETLVRPIIGGAGTLFGPLIGGVVLGPISEFARGALSSYHGVYPMMYGLLLILVIIYMPRGIVGLYRRLTRPRRTEIQHG